MSSLVGPRCYDCKSTMERVEGLDVKIKNDYGEFKWEVYRCPKCNETGGPTFEKSGDGTWVQTGEAF